VKYCDDIFLAVPLDVEENGQARIEFEHPSDTPFKQKAMLQVPHIVPPKPVQSASAVV
jgi:hypothetical protein